jgi:hypothetical protein
MVTRVRKNVVTETTEEALLKEGFVEEPLEEIVPIELKVELKEEKAKEPVVEDTPKSEVIRWKKIGNGSFILNNRYIKPGQVFTATVEEIPTAFRDLIVPVDKLPDDPFKKPKKVVNYSLSQTEDGKWNIVDKLGKVFNDSPMELNEAEKVLNVL